MNFSKTTSYALKVLNFMAENDKEIFSARHLHTKLDIPWPYLRKLLTRLSKSGLIKSTRGRTGGFILAKDINSIFIADIIDTVEGLEVLTSCIMGFKKCPFNYKCALHNVWADTQKQIIDILKNTSLAYLKNPS